MLGVRPMVGRDRELTELRQAMDRLVSGEAPVQVVQIDGDAGIGKTRLLDELLGLAAERGVRTLRGRATEYETHVPFALFGTVVADLDPADAEQRAALDLVLSVPGHVPAPGTTGTERYRLHRTLQRLLSAASHPPGTVYALDDVHWADESSLELLDHLLRRPPRPCLVAVAFRAGQAPARLAAALARTAAPIVRLSPGPLPTADVDRLLAGQPPARRAALGRISGGNPFYLEALSRVDDEALATLARSAQTGPHQLPPALSAVLGGELDALDHDRRTVAHALAVAGDTAALDIVVETAQLPADRVSRAVDDLVARGVVRCAGARFVFRHPLLRAAAYQSAGPAWRIGAHRRAERHLRRQGAPVAVRAHHAALVACYGDPETVDSLIAAAGEALYTAPATAAYWLRSALDCLTDRQVDRRTEVSVMLARALSLCGELAESRHLLHEMLGHPTPARPLAVRYLVVTERLLGRLSEARALLEAELADSPARGPLLVELAGNHLLGNDLPAARRYAEAAVEEVAGRPDPAQGAAARTLTGLVALHDGRPAEAAAAIRAAGTILDALTDVDVREHLHVLPALAWAETHLGRHDDAQRRLDRGAEIARRAGRTAILPYLSIMATYRATHLGELAEAAQHAADATEMSLLIGSPETLAMTRAAALPAALWTDGPAVAADQVDQLLREGRPASQWWAAVADLAAAEVLLAAGDDRRCLAMLRDRASAGVVPVDRPAHEALLAVALARTGDAEQALAHAEAAVAAADQVGLPTATGHARLGQARVLTHLHRWPEAAQAATAAVHAYTAAGSRIRAAIARHAAARALVETGDTAPARALLGEAKQAYAGAGARWLAARVLRTETRLGARATRPGRAGPALSEREREIAALVAAGLTNKEIGRQLYLSPKTVEAHLRKIFAKLDVRSRVELARALSVERT